MRTVKALALVRGNVLLSVHAIFQNGEVVKLPVMPQHWEKLKMMEEFIKKLLKANHMAVNRYEIAGTLYKAIKLYPEEDDYGDSEIYS